MMNVKEPMLSLEFRTVPAAVTFLPAGTVPDCAYFLQILA